MNESSARGAESDAQLQFPRLQAASADHILVARGRHGGAIAADVGVGQREIACHGVGGMHIESEGKGVIVVRVPRYLYGDAEVAVEGVSVLGAALRCGGEVDAVAVGGRLHAVVQWRPDEVVLQTCGESPVGREVVVRHQRQVQAESVLAVVGREVVAIAVHGGTGRKA